MLDAALVNECKALNRSTALMDMESSLFHAGTPLRRTSVLATFILH